MKLKKTVDGVYYFQDYIPVRLRSVSAKDREESIKLLKFKDSISKEIDNYSLKLIEAIVKITKDINTKKIALVAVPSSKVNKKSSLCECIKIISALSKRGVIQDICTGYNKQILDYSDLLLRKYDMQAAHESKKRPTYEQQFDSIRCTKDKLSKEWATFVILDDVTTTGTIMKVCEDKLIKNGALKKYIRKLAIARTVGYDLF